MPDHPSAPSPNPWLSYAEAGERLGMSAEAVRTKARRAGWRRMPGNDGRTLVQVPEGADEQPPVRSPAHSGLIETLREAVALLGEQLQAERSRVDSARAELEAERAEANTARAEVAAERSRADGVRVELEAGRARADADRVEIARLAGELAEKQEELAGHRARADKAEQTARAVQHDLAAAQAVASEASHRADRAQVETQEAAQALDQIRRADEARKARGRLRRAWDGWRGR